MNEQEDQKVIEVFGASAGAEGGSPCAIFALVQIAKTNCTGDASS
jgi:hypothetical protein